MTGKYTDCIIIKDNDSINLKQIFESGQCFRWRLNASGYYEGVASGKAIQVKYCNEDGGSILLCGKNIEDNYKFWYKYFDLGRDYQFIRESLSKIDPVMAKAVEYGKGLRILKQEFWETLVSFILSANNMIPRISKSVEALACAFGEPIERQSGVYAFPDSERLLRTGPEGISICRGGFRCKYIYCAAQMVSSGVINEILLRSLEIGDARKELLKIPGVGAKIADCVLLYSGIAYDVFPVDIWVRRVMEALYFKRKVSMKEISSFALDHFGKLAGFAQLYLFYYARKNNIGK